MMSYRVEEVFCFCHCEKPRNRYYYSDEAPPEQRRSQHSSPGKRYGGGGQAWKGTGFLFQYKNPP